MKQHRALSTKIIDRIPQSIHLRTDLFIHLKNKRETSLFWNIFTSMEYLMMVPILATINFDDGIVIDCGAGIGLFSLLIAHCIRLKLLNWENIKYFLIEPSPLNLATLMSNFQSNFSPKEYSVQQGLVGKKEGYDNFYFSKFNKWSSSVIDHKLKHTKVTTIPYYDLTRILGGPKNILMKIDIEGSEYDFFDNYLQQLSSVKLLIIEWHKNFGNPFQCENKLFDLGFKELLCSVNDSDVKLSLYTHC